MVEQHDISNWQTDKSLTECLEHVLEEETWCDVTIRVDSGDDTITRIRAHEFILKARSPVFEAMFSGGFAESSREVSIRNSEPGLVKDMIRFMYSDKIHLTIQNLLGMRNLARMYMLKRLEHHCEEFIKTKMKSHLSISNIHVTLTDSIASCQEDAVMECLKFCEEEYIVHILNSDNFTDLSHAALCRLAQHDRLIHVKEIDLIQACVNWAKQHQAGGDSLRTVLGQIIHDIRFHVMSFEQFSEVIQTDPSILSDEETECVRSLLEYHSQDHCVNLSRLGFNMLPRVNAWRRKLDTSWSAPRGSKYEYKGKEVMHIFPNENVIFHGISVMAGKNGLHHKFTINLGYTTTKLAESECKISINGPSLVYPLYLETPLRLESDKDYTIIAYPPDDNECFFRANDATVFHNGGNTLTVCTGVFDRPAEMQGKPDATGISRDWRLSYIHTLYLQPCT